jgi:hypothetical protein
MDISIEIRAGFSTRQQAAEERFARRLSRARLARFAASLLSRVVSLPSLAGGRAGERSSLGLQEIPLGEIIGSVRPSRDFDAKFRPLRAELRQRWVALLLNGERDRLGTVQLLKYRNAYYVESDCMLVSLARELGNEYISAEVWELAADTSSATQPSARVCIELAAHLPTAQAEVR